ncbi:MAG: nucleotidyltransferase domain-containing protein [Muribaculaceae bacterium]|nr:nucleotidyltransferase domain-containing protein [Muribaculaceae bacterium]
MCTKSELQQVLKEVRSAAKQLYGDKLDKIILYGSYARGDNTEESDIDIMIVLDGDAADIKKLRGLTAEMASDISLEQEVFLSILLRDRKYFEENLDFLPFYISRILSVCQKYDGNLDYKVENGICSVCAVLNPRSF